MDFDNNGCECLCSATLISVSHHISGTQLFQKNRQIHIHVLVVLKPMVPLIGLIVDGSARIAVDRQADRPTTVTFAPHARRGLITCSLHKLPNGSTHVDGTWYA